MITASTATYSLDRASCSKLPSHIARPASQGACVCALLSHTHTHLSHSLIPSSTTSRTLTHTLIHTLTPLHLPLHLHHPSFGSEKLKPNAISVSAIRRLVKLMGMVDPPQGSGSSSSNGGGLSMQKLDIIISGLGVQCVTVFGFTYVLAVCACKKWGRGRSSSSNSSSRYISPSAVVVKLIDALSDYLCMHAEAAQQQQQSEVDSMSTSMPMSMPLTFDDAGAGAGASGNITNNSAPLPLVHHQLLDPAVSRLLEAEKGTLHALYSAYTEPAGQGQADGMSLDGATSFARDMGIVPHLLMWGGFNQLFTQSILTSGSASTSASSAVGGGSDCLNTSATATVVSHSSNSTSSIAQLQHDRDELSFSDFCYLIVQLALCPSATRCDLRADEWEVTVQPVDMLCNLFMWINSHIVQWHEKVTKRVRHRHVRLVSFDLASLRSAHSKTNVDINVRAAEVPLSVRLALGTRTPTRAAFM